jgi:curved DNA-binding protein CbpA
MNDLHKAYSVLGMEPGASMKSIMERYDQLIMIWHPDRVHSPERKQFAEDELKKINNAKDVLVEHFNGGGHQQSGCECQAEQTHGTADSRQESSGATGPGYHRSRTSEDKQSEDDAARRRDAERKHHEQQETNRKQAEETQQQRPSEERARRAIHDQKALHDEKLRWQVTLGIVMTFVGLEMFGCVCNTVKDCWRDAVRQANHARQRQTQRGGDFWEWLNRLAQP